MAAFIGTFGKKIDRKGRVSVPTKFRPALHDGTGHRLIVSPNFDQKAIDACDFQRIEEMITRLDQPGAYTPEQRHAAEIILSRSEEVVLDTEGRVVLPPSMLELAGVETEAAFVGIGRIFQVWDPDRRSAYETNSLAQTDSASLSLKDLYALGSPVGAATTTGGDGT